MRTNIIVKNYYHINELCSTYPELGGCRNDILAAYVFILACYKQEGKLLVCGNGGSCSDSGHIVGELMKSFEASRPIEKELKDELIRVSPVRGNQLAENLEFGLPAISLNAHEALLSAILNDIGPNYVFAQQVVGYGRRGDVLLALSSSGNSQNVLDATIVAKAMGIKVVGLTGASGGRLKNFCDVTICVPASKTSKIQEYHLPIYHSLCKEIEYTIFDSRNKIESK